MAQDSLPALNSTWASIEEFKVAAYTFARPSSYLPPRKTALTQSPQSPNESS